MNATNRSGLRAIFAGVIFSLAVFAATPSEGRSAILLAAAPTPILTPVPKAPVNTLDSLQSKIRQRLLVPEVRRGRVGVKIASLASGKVIFENDAEKYFTPASNMKNFTVAAAIEKLTPEFRFVTSVFAAGMPDSSGTIKGDLRIFGRGDISISTAFNNGDYYKGLDNLVDKITAAGVKRIEGNIVGDESYFKGFAIPQTWEWNDLQWYDGAEISALPINNNSVDLSVKPGTQNEPCLITVLPERSSFKLINRCMTSSAGSRPSLKVFKPLDKNFLEISGSMPAGDKPFAGYIGVTHPADLFIGLLKQRLELRGVTVSGGTRTIPTTASLEPPQIEIARLESPPLSIIAGKTMKPSQNMYTETILWTLGERLGRTGGIAGDSDQLGLGVVRGFLRQVGIPDDAVLQYDGSGLSRRNLITPSAIISLYTYMSKQSKYSQVWRDSLTVGGVDGTLQNRFKGTAAAGNIRGKTGTLDQVSALSAYLTTAAGDQLVISIIVNGVAESKARTSLIDEIVVDVSNYNGKIDQ